MLLLAFVVACDAGHPKSKPPPPPPPQNLTLEQQKIVAQFSPAIVGTLTPRPVEAGIYTLTLAVAFDILPTPELEVTGKTDGTVMLSLEAGGVATSCVTLQVYSSTAGQWHYEPEEKRSPRRATDNTRQVVMTGHWTIIDGTTLIAFDKSAFNTCDPTAVQRAPASPMLRCIATSATTKLPDAVACIESNPLVAVGTEMDGREHMNEPRGDHVILARGGIHVKVEQLRAAPTITFSR